MLGLTVAVTWGIVAGSVVFVATIGTVFLLLYYGGSFDRIKQEQIGMPAEFGEQKPEIYDELLEKARTLPRKPTFGQKLTGTLVQLRLLKVEQDAKTLFSISNGSAQGGIYGDEEYNENEFIWRYLEHGPFKSVEAFRSACCQEGDDELHLVVCDVESDKIIGMMSLVNNSPKNLRIEIANVWYTPAFQGSLANTEAVLLVLKHLFELGYRRVEWRCDGHNVRARKAAHSLGFLFEGVLRKCQIVKKCNCDVAVFAALNSNWQLMAEQLEHKLAGAKARKAQEKLVKEKKQREKEKKQRELELMKRLKQQNEQDATNSPTASGKDHHEPHDANKIKHKNKKSKSKQKQSKKKN